MPGPGDPLRGGWHALMPHRVWVQVPIARCRMNQPVALTQFALDSRAEQVGGSLLVHADCFAWMDKVPESSIHAIVTDPPYGVKEYDFDQIEKRNNGRGGIWRIPPSFDGHRRAP